MTESLSPSAQPNPLEGWTAEEIQRSYPFGYHVFPDGSVYGRDPLQEANAGHDVDPAEIDEALRRIDEERTADEFDLFSEL